MICINAAWHNVYIGYDAYIAQGGVGRTTWVAGSFFFLLSICIQRKKKSKICVFFCFTAPILIDSVNFVMSVELISDKFSHKWSLSSKFD